MSNNKTDSAMDRRRMLRAMGAVLAVAPLAKLVGCASPNPSGDGGADAGADAMSSADATLEDAIADSASAADAVVSEASAGAWATGGTRVIATSYPDPFSAPGSVCELICQTTIGPCHTLSPLRQDVSDSLDGIPMRLALRILDEACNPIPNAIVEIWHTNYKGIYSGNINTMCNSAAEDRAAQYFRGYQRTDANGRVDFNTCFPGWYSSRAVHIHVRVMSGDYNASDSAAASVITQLLFTDELIQQIFSQVSLYSAFGQPDTLLARDNVVGSVTDKSPYLLDISRMSDGVMLASKTMIVKNATSGSTVCSVGGMGGMGAPPGG